ncbi:MAG TPA: ankyrin repeat domain-containing protein [Candidatus Deferrimicrobiaceae bacterium]|jgi:tetratricopeptide (TPR) repeat protein
MKRYFRGLLLAFPLLAITGCSASQTQLNRAIHEGDAPRAKNLLDSGISPKEKGACAPDDGYESTPLTCAIRMNRMEIVKLLFARGADVNQLEPYGHTQLMAAAEQNTEMVRLLLEKGADVNRRGAGLVAGRTALMSAAGAGKTDVVKLLLDRGAEINARSHYGWTALTVAALHQHRAVAKVLISKGADIDYAITKVETHASEAKHAKLEAEDRAAAILLRELRDTVKACPIKPPRDASAEREFEKVAEKYRLLPVKPVLPEEAREFRVRAEYAIGQKQFQDAVDLYSKALKISPWWPEGYFNQALILGEMHCPEEAIAAMNKYIALVPGAPDVRAAKDKIYQWKGMVP